MSDGSQLDLTERRLVTLLKAERIRQGISATALASTIKVSRTTVTHIESNESRPTLWVLLRIAQGLNVSLAHFLRKAETAQE